MPAEYIGKDVAVVALDSMLAAYYEGKQIALHRISYQRKDMVVNPQHYRKHARLKKTEGHRRGIPTVKERTAKCICD